MKKNISSFILAKRLGKRHDNLMRTIERYAPTLGGLFGDYFKPSTFKNAHNVKYPCYIITPEGYDVLMGRKGTKNTNDALAALGNAAKAIRNIFGVDKEKSFHAAADLTEKFYGVDLSAIRELF